MSEVFNWSAKQTAENIADRKISVVEVTEIHLARAAAVNPKINALTETLSEEALATAKQLDAQRPDVLPPLFGVPMTTKINVDQKGLVNSNGIPAFKDNICDQDSPVVANMKAAGGVIIARTNTPEFSMRWCTSNPLHGVTLNPWDNAVTPGGSSGGAAAAIAAGIGAIAHGNDLGGSLRYPAACCGVVSIRPSLGRVPAFNPSATAERPMISGLMSVQGPIARSVEDVRLGLHAMARGDNRDPLWVPAPAQKPLGDAALRIGYCIDMFGDGVDQAVEDGMNIAIQALKDAGCTLVEVTPPHANRTGELWGDLLHTEVNHTSLSTIRDLGSKEMNVLLDANLSIYQDLGVSGLLNGLAERRTIQRAWAVMFADVDILLLPTSGKRPFANDLDFNTPESIPEILNAQKFLCAINLLGLPAVAVPTHLDHGVPIGVQLVAPLHQDYFALDVAAMFEREVGTIVQQLAL